MSEFTKDMLKAGGTVALLYTFVVLVCLL